MVETIFVADNQGSPWGGKSQEFLLFQHAFLPDNLYWRPLSGSVIVDICVRCSAPHHRRHWLASPGPPLPCSPIVCSSVCWRRCMVCCFPILSHRGLSIIFGGFTSTPPPTSLKPVLPLLLPISLLVFGGSGARIIYYIYFSFSCWVLTHTGGLQNCQFHTCLVLWSWHLSVSEGWPLCRVILYNYIYLYI
jgi:hypothetical protein